ncbi:PhoH family protein [Patescibacteria group bacterium]|nr:PhoH family protein [Patescibacteria group bacterium]
MEEDRIIKNYILDTNVLIHDPDSLFSFENNNVYIPFIVIQELDGLKKEEGEVGRNAREAIRNIDSIGIDNKITEEKGFLLIINVEGINKLKGDIKKNDDIIISSAIILKEDLKKKSINQEIILISKDQAVRIKAEIHKVETEDYKKDKTDRFENYGIIFPENEDYTNGIRSVRYQIDEKDGFAYKKIWGENEKQLLRKVKPIYGIFPKNMEQECSMLALMDKSIDIVALTGKAGTGKTFIAILLAMLERELNNYEQIIITRPNIPINRSYELGFKPGDTGEKMQEWTEPIIDNIKIILRYCLKRKKENTQVNKRNFSGKSIYSTKKFEGLIKEELIIVQPLESIRGRSLSNKFFIIDEAQNLTPKDMKTIITRCGEGTKVVLTGDLDQIDSRFLDKTSNGLAYLIDKFLDEENFCFINLTEILRSKLANQAANLL